MILIAKRSSDDIDQNIFLSPASSDAIIEKTCQRYWSLFKSIRINPSASLSLLSFYNHCDPIIQIGPTCGLVALLMCLKSITKIEIDLPEILERAKSHGYTKFGEMFSVLIFDSDFSAENMSNFINKEFLLRSELKSDTERSMLTIVKHLCQGLPILIPYDADANYEPCMKEGSRAHWAILNGFCILSEVEKDVLERNQPPSLIKQTDLDNELQLFEILDEDHHQWRKIYHYIKRFLTLDKLFVYARQGRSRHLQIWSFKKLMQSNQNLKKVSSKILNDPERSEMIYPQDGRIDKTLANNFILIFRD
ncbi:SERTA domain-containing protein 2 [Sarcoptes scabiei]|nr:SERTA domain-containing protein 2 [Sarcoptes scabiei]